MQVSEKLKIHGQLTITRSDGLLLVRENIVVQQAIYSFLTGMALGTTPSPISTIQFGTGGTSDSAGLLPIAPSYSQTELNSPLGSAPVAYSNLSFQNNFVTFSASVGQSQFNGFGISEAGLFTAAGQMFNYVTFPAVQKSSLFGLSFSWNVGF